MMTPWELQQAKPSHGAVRGLHDRWGVYAASLNIWRPWVAVDRKAETMPGFEALIWHESTHAVEWHALLGAVVLLAGAVEFAVGVALELWVPALLGPVVALVLWGLWRREQEIRSDAIALYGSGLGGLPDDHPARQDPGAVAFFVRRGLAEFRNFLRMHPHPASVPGLSRLARAWEGWKYGRTIAHRENRAVARCRRLGWEVRSGAPD